MLTFSTSVSAYFEMEGSSVFKTRVQDYLNTGKQISPHTRRLIDALANSSQRIKIVPITSDPSTWHPAGDPERSHTRVAKGQSKAKKRQRPVDAIIYVNVKRITPSHKSYSRGTLMHELVHALDLASGRYHDDYVIREKRAVFFQNIWRMWHSSRLRKHYHQKFKTLEYQQALDAGLINEFVEYFFKYNDLP